MDQWSEYRRKLLNVLGSRLSVRSSDPHTTSRDMEDVVFEGLLQPARPGRCLLARRLFQAACQLEGVRGIAQHLASRWFLSGGNLLIACLTRR